MHSFIVEAIGYLASIFLAISLVVNNDLKFRWINAFGCLSFIIYGVFINAVPIIFTNGFLLAINIYYLIKIYRSTEDFDMISFKGNEKLILKFLEFYKADIKNYFPDYTSQIETNNLKFVVLRDLVIANIFIGEMKTGGVVLVKLNYTVPKYRDYEVGRFIFNKKKEFLISRGVSKLIYDEVTNNGHKKFLKVMGFKKIYVDGKESYTKELLPV
jgi:hypothetical protein